MSDPVICPRRQEIGAFVSQPSKKGDMSGDQCSYCGSISPERLFKAIEAGAEIGPTDKNYKAYVKGDGMKFAKFYFQHMSDEDKTRFIKMLNERKVNIGFPGHFYVLPFFVGRKEPQKAAS